jgi:sugar O-acyltransferase (sialic acid O-acetyltransferase NeuD family)
MRKYGLIGAGGHGRDTMPVLAEMLGYDRNAPDGSLTFVIEGADLPVSVNGYDVMSFDEFCRLEGDIFFNISIADSRTRERIAATCQSAKLKPFSIVSRTAVIMDDNEIGEGAILSPFVTVTSNVRIGRFFHANIHSYVTHDCVIGDFVTFAPGVMCNGNVTIGDHAFIGAGAILRNGSKARPLRIGKGAVVGMGAVVVEDVPDCATVVGNPARPMNKSQRPSR